MNPPRSSWPRRFSRLFFLSFLIFFSSPEDSFPDAVPEQFQKGVLALQERRFSEAEAAFRSVLEEEPENALALFNLGNVLFQRRQYDEAEQLFQKVLVLRPEFVEAYLHLAQIDLVEKDLEAAFHYYFQAYWLSPIDSAVERLGEKGMETISIEEEIKLGIESVQKAVQEGKVSEGERKLWEVLELAPESAQLWNLLGIVLGIERRYDEAMSAFQQSVRILPTFSVPWIRMGELLELQGKFTEAREAYETALILREEPEGPQAEQAERNLKAVEAKIDLKGILDQGDNLFNKGEFESALRVYQVALERYPQEGLIYLKVGTTLGRMNRFTDALSMFEKGVEKTPNDVIGRQRIGQIQEAMRLFGRAEKSYLDALARAAEGPIAAELRETLIRLEKRRSQAEGEAEMRVTAGKEQLNTGSVEEGLELLQQAAVINPENAEIHALLFSVYEAQEETNSAITALRRVLEFNSAASWAHRELANIYGKEHFYRQALKELDKIETPEDNKLSTLRLELQEALSEANERQRPFLDQSNRLRIQGDFAGAYKAAQKAILERPDDPVGHALLAEIYADRGDLVSARAQWERTVLLGPSSANAAIGLAKTLEKGGALARAEDAYEKALRLVRPDQDALEKEAREGLDRVSIRMMNNAEALRYLERGIRFMGKGDYVSAEEALRFVLFLYPDHSEARFQLADSQRRQGKLKEAEAGFQQAIRQNPSFAPSRVFLGNIYLEQGKTQKAIDQYQVAQGLLEGSGIPEEDQINEKLKRLKRRHTVNLSQTNTYDSNATLAAEPEDDFSSNLGFTFKYFLLKGSKLRLPVGLSSDNTFRHYAGRALSDNALTVSINPIFSEELSSSIDYSFRYIWASGGIATNTHNGSASLIYQGMWPGRIQLQYSYRKFTSFLDSLFDFDSETSTVRVSVAKRFLTTEVINMSYGYSKTEVETSSLSTRSQTGSLSYSHDFSKNLKGLLGYTLILTNYLEPNRFHFIEEGELVNRKNNKHILSAGVVYSFIDSVSFSLNLFRVWNRSNLRNFVPTDPVFRNAGHPFDEGPYKKTLISARIDIWF